MAAPELVDGGAAEQAAAQQRAGRSDSHPMSILRTGVSLLSHTDPEVEDNSPAAELRKAKRLTAQIATAIGHIHSGTIAGKLNGVMPATTPSA